MPQIFVAAVTDSIHETEGKGGPGLVAAPKKQNTPKVYIEPEDEIVDWSKQQEIDEEVVDWSNETKKEEEAKEMEQNKEKEKQNEESEESKETKTEDDDDDGHLEAERDRLESQEEIDIEQFPGYSAHGVVSQSDYVMQKNPFFSSLVSPSKDGIMAQSRMK